MSEFEVTVRCGALALVVGLSGICGSLLTGPNWLAGAVGLGILGSWSGWVAYGKRAWLSFPRKP